MNPSASILFDVLRYVLGTSDTRPRLTCEEWKEVLRVATEQTIDGIAALALRPLWNVKHLEARPDLTDAYLKAEHPGDGMLFAEIVLKYLNRTVAIVEGNMHVNKNVRKVFRFFREAGFECCLLKGQGTALLYPYPEYRASGDIDVWVRWGKHVPEEVAKVVARKGGRTKSDEDVRKIIRFVKFGYPHNAAYYHHVEAPAMHGTPVEIHYRPQYLHCFFYNRRLQKYFLENADAQFAHRVPFGGGTEISVPAPDFNVVMQLSHIYKHLLFEGIGLRQIVDFFYVMRALDGTEPREGRKERWTPRLEYLGMRKLSGALMWILEVMLGMDASWAVTESDERRGRLMLDDIIQGGNFGHNDQRLFGQEWGRERGSEEGGGSWVHRFRIRENAQRFYRDWRMVRAFPSESLSEPAFRFWNFLWRRRHNGKNV